MPFEAIIGERMNLQHSGTSDLVIKHGRTDIPNLGPYFVAVMRGPRLSSSAGGLKSPEDCQRRAEEWSKSFGARIVTPHLKN